jgi:hypothetical protein
MHNRPFQAINKESKPPLHLLGSDRRIGRFTAQSSPDPDETETPTYTAIISYRYK